MFKFLKEKIKNAVSKLSSKIEEEGEEEIKEEAIEKPKEKGFFAKLKETFVGKESPVPEKEEKKISKEEIVPEHKKEAEIKKEHRKIEEKKEKVELKKREEKLAEKIKEAPKEAVKKEAEKKEEYKEPLFKKEEIPKKEEEAEVIKEIPEEKKGFFAKLKEKIITKKINESQFDEMFWELEVALLENSVAVEVIEKIKFDLKKDLVDKPILRGKIEETISDSLRKAIIDLFDVEKIDFIKEIKNKKPFVVCFFGINGSGKTTTIAKIVKLLQDNKISCVLAASDTFRAAAIDQLQQHANKLGVAMVKHDYGADPAAVAFDAIKKAESKGIDVVLIDTAGRMHSNVNLMDEMKKIIRVAKPDLKIFVGESITGNDCVEQAQKFNESVGLDGIILSKADVDEKGGAAISISYVTKKPIIFIGTGQRYDDLKEFNPQTIIESLGL